MSSRILGYLLLALGGVLYFLLVATFISMLQALTVRDTITAVESAFGSLVLLLILFWAARHCWRAGKARLNPEQDPGVSGETKP